MGSRRKGRQSRRQTKPRVKKAEQQVTCGKQEEEEGAEKVDGPVDEKMLATSSRRKQELKPKEDSVEEGVKLLAQTRRSSSQGSTKNLELLRIYSAVLEGGMQQPQLVTFRPSTSKPFVPRARSLCVVDGRKPNLPEVITLSSSEDEEDIVPPLLKTAECQTSPHLTTGENNNDNSGGSSVHPLVFRPVAIVLPSTTAVDEEGEGEEQHQENQQEIVTERVEESSKEEEDLIPNTPSANASTSAQVNLTMDEREEEDTQRIWRPRRETLLTANSSVGGLVSLKDLVNVPTPMLLAALAARRREVDSDRVEDPPETESPVGVGIEVNSVDSGVEVSGTIEPQTLQTTAASVEGKELKSDTQSPSHLEEEANNRSEGIFYIESSASSSEGEDEKQELDEEQQTDRGDGAIDPATSLVARGAENVEKTLLTALIDLNDGNFSAKDKSMTLEELLHFDPKRTDGQSESIPYSLEEQESFEDLLDFGTMDSKSETAFVHPCKLFFKLTAPLEPEEFSLPMSWIESRLKTSRKKTAVSKVRKTTRRGNELKEIEHFMAALASKVLANTTTTNLVPQQPHTDEEDVRFEVIERQMEELFEETHDPHPTVVTSECPASAIYHDIPQSHPLADENSENLASVGDSKCNGKLTLELQDVVPSISILSVPENIQTTMPPPSPTWQFLQDSVCQSLTFDETQQMFLSEPVSVTNVPFACPDGGSGSITSSDESTATVEIIREPGKYFRSSSTDIKVENDNSLSSVSSSEQTSMQESLKLSCCPSNHQMDLLEQTVCSAQRSVTVAASTSLCIETELPMRKQESSAAAEVSAASLSPPLPKKRKMLSLPEVAVPDEMQEVPLPAPLDVLVAKDTFSDEIQKEVSLSAPVDVLVAKDIFSDEMQKEVPLPIDVLVGKDTVPDETQKDISLHIPVHVQVEEDTVPDEILGEKDTVPDEMEKEITLPVPVDVQVEKNTIPDEMQKEITLPVPVDVQVEKDTVPDEILGEKNTVPHDEAQVEEGTVSDDELQEANGVVDNVEYTLRLYQCRICCGHFFAQDEFLQHFIDLHEFPKDFDFQIGRTSLIENGKEPRSDAVYGGVEDYEKALGHELPGKNNENGESSESGDEDEENSSNYYSSFTSEDEDDSLSSSSDDDLVEGNGESGSDFFEEELKGNLEYALRTGLSSDEEERRRNAKYTPCLECNQYIHKHNIKRHYRRFHPESLDKLEQPKPKGERKGQQILSNAEETSVPEEGEKHANSESTNQNVSAIQCVELQQPGKVVETATLISLKEQVAPSETTTESSSTETPVSHPSNANPLMCPSCHKTLSSIWSLRRHTQKVHGFLITRANDTTKEKTQQSPSSISNIFPVSPLCQVCHTRFKNSEALEDHLSRKHVPYTGVYDNYIHLDPWIQCRICYRHMRRSKLISHLEGSHVPYTMSVANQCTLISPTTKTDDDLEIIEVKKRPPPALVKFIPETLNATGAPRIVQDPRFLFRGQPINVTAVIQPRPPSSRFVVRPLPADVVVKKVTSINTQQQPPLQETGVTSRPATRHSTRSFSAAVSTVSEKPPIRKVSILTKSHIRPTIPKVIKTVPPLVTQKGCCPNKSPQLASLNPSQIQVSMNSVIRPILLTKPKSFKPAPSASVMVRGPPPPEKCPKCHRVFADVKEALTHRNSMLYEHRAAFGLRETARIGCGFCPVTFELWESACLRVHVDTSHSANLSSVNQQGIPRLFKCATGTCRSLQDTPNQKSFYSVDALISHVWTHRVNPLKNYDVKSSIKSKVGTSNNLELAGGQTRNNEP